MTIMKGPLSHDDATYVEKDWSEREGEDFFFQESSFEDEKKYEKYEMWRGNLRSFLIDVEQKMFKALATGKPHGLLVNILWIFSIH